VATGIEEHANYAIDLHRSHPLDSPESCRTRTSPVRGVERELLVSAATTPVREAIHTAFLYHADPAGMDMASVKRPGQLRRLRSSHPELKERSRTCC